jgi:hypothetical protein
MISPSEIEGARKGLIVGRKRLGKPNFGGLYLLHDEDLGRARKSDHIEEQNERKKRLHGWPLLSCLVAASNTATLSGVGETEHEPIHRPPKFLWSAAAPPKQG